MPKKKKSGGTFFEREMFESQAYLSLKGFSPQLLVLMLGKRNFDRVKNHKGSLQHICTNGDNIILTYQELRTKYGVSQPRITRAVDELLAKGFIEIKHYGGAFKQDRTIYALSDKWKLWGPDIVFSTRRRDVRRGFQGGKKKA